MRSPVAVVGPLASLTETVSPSEKGSKGVNTRVRESSERASLPGWVPLWEPSTETAEVETARASSVLPGRMTTLFQRETRREPGEGERY
jgi:hypothetical protein